MKKKPKRIEWLNLYSKGFIIESINNNYFNEDIIVKRENKSSLNKLYKNKNDIIDSTGNKTISFEKASSTISNKIKENISFDKKESYYVDLNELILDSKDLINKEKIIKKKEIKKKKNIEKNKSTININFINIEQNIIVKKPKKKKEIKNKKKELKNEISSPLINYINIQRKKDNIINKNQIIKKGNEKTIDKNKEYKKYKKEIKLKNMNVFQYINNKGIIINKNNNRNKNNFDNRTNKVKLGEIRDYTFDDESFISEDTINDNFSAICNTTYNRINQSNESKYRLNIFLNGTNNNIFKKEKIEEIKKIMSLLKK